MEVRTASRQPDDGLDESLALTWLGQAGFLIEGAGARLLVDPWFSAHELRVASPPLISDLPDDIGWLIATHEHADHLDLAGIAELHARMPNIRVVVPTPVLAKLAEAVPVDAQGLQPGDRLIDGAVVIEAVPAWHGVAVKDGYSEGPRGLPTPHVGYVIRVAGVSIYHAGDTIASPKLIDALREARVDIALLPINGRDFFREASGILGNLDAAEAAELAHAIGARILVPMHYDMVQGNTAPAGAVVDAAARLALPLHIVVPTRGLPVRLHVRVR